MNNSDINLARYGSLPLNGSDLSFADSKSFPFLSWPSCRAPPLACVHEETASDWPNPVPRVFSFSFFVLFEMELEITSGHTMSNSISLAKGIVISTRL